jgi:hypothetical protein
MTHNSKLSLAFIGTTPEAWNSPVSDPGNAHRFDEKRGIPVLRTLGLGFGFHRTQRSIIPIIEEADRMPNGRWRGDFA